MSEHIAEKDEPTCRACYAASLTVDERERFNAEPVTSCVYLCPDHEAAIAEALARFPMPTFVRARQARTAPYVFPTDEGRP